MGKAACLIDSTNTERFAFDKRTASQIAPAQQLAEGAGYVSPKEGFHDCRRALGTGTQELQQAIVSGDCQLGGHAAALGDCHQLHGRVYQALVAQGLHVLGAAGGGLCNAGQCQAGAFHHLCILHSQQESTVNAGSLIANRISAANEGDDMSVCMCAFDRLCYRVLHLAVIRFSCDQRSLVLLTLGHV